jgi:hypothetical protein
MAKTATAKQLSILDKFKDLKPEGGLPVFKFSNQGDAIVGKLIARRVGIHTKMGVGNAIDVNILENSNGAELGPHSVFESGHITKIFDQHAPKPGDTFILKLDSIDEKSNFKRFAFKLVESASSAPTDDDIPF